MHHEVKCKFVSFTNIGDLARMCTLLFWGTLLKKVKIELNKP